MDRVSDKPSSLVEFYLIIDIVGQLLRLSMHVYDICISTHHSCTISLLIVSFSSIIGILSVSE